MNYPLKSSNFEERQKNVRKKIWLTVVTLLIALILIGLPFSRNILFKIASPLWKLENWFVSVNSHNLELFRSKNALITENNDLKKKLALMYNMISLNQIIQTENDDLKALLERKDVKQNSVLAWLLIMWRTELIFFG